MRKQIPLLEADRFRHHLNDIIVTENLYRWLDTTPKNFDLEILVDSIVSNYINVENFVKSVTLDEVLKQLESYSDAGQKTGRRMVLAPCSPLFSSVLESLSCIFENIIFIDSGRAGLKLGNHIIQSPEHVDPQIDDLCLIMTRNTEATEFYEKMFGKNNTLDFLRLHNKKKQSEIALGIPDLVTKINSSRKPVLLASPRPLGTLSSSIRQMKRDGYSTFWLGAEEVKNDDQTGYSTPKVDDLALTDYAIGGLFDVIHVFSNMMKGTALFHFEAIYPPAWDFKRVAICYASTLAIIRTVKECRVAGSQACLALYMYDAIKPGVKNFEAGETCGRLYQLMMEEAEAVIFSSYTDAFGDFVENSIGKPLRRVHSHRYQIVPKIRRERLKDGYHIAVISVLLEEFWEPSRMGLVPYIRGILAQGLHIHYYVGNSSRARIQQFRNSLPKSHRLFFHMHVPIHDPEELSFELSCYHVGWSLFNMQIFNDMTCNLTDQFTRDAMDLFTPTTLPSVIWSCAAAGLPVICNRSMRGVVDMLPAGMALPLTLSELGNLQPVLDRIDWRAIDRISLADLDISNQIYKFYNFLDGLYEKPNK